jgi:exodeoxyribonuclease VII large subunit
MIESRTEKLDHMRQRLSAARAALLRAEITRINQRRDLVVGLAERLEPALAGQIGRKADRLNAVAHLFDSLNYKSVLKRGFALVRDADGQPLRSADAVTDGQALVLEFADGKADAMGGRGVARPKVLKPKLVVAEEQGALF